MFKKKKKKKKLIIYIYIYTHTIINPFAHDYKLIYFSQNFKLLSIMRLLFIIIMVNNYVINNYHGK